MKKQLFSATIILFLIINFSFAYNPEHLKILLSKDISASWYKWRQKNQNIKADLSSAVINGANFEGDFTFTNFRNAKIFDSVLVNADFIHADLSYSEIKKTRSFLIYPSNRTSFICKNSVFFKAKIMDSKFISADFYGVNFNESEIQNTEFSSCSIKYTSFLKSKIDNLNLSCELFAANFSNSTINKSKIEGLKFFNVKFQNAKITDSVIYAENLNNLDFSYSDLIKVEFGSSRFTNASFIGANLTGSSFGDKNYPEATLTNVNFTNANLTKVNFHKSKFQNVIFKNADMTGAKLERKWYEYVKKQGVRNFDKIQWM